MARYVLALVLVTSISVPTSVSNAVPVTSSAGCDGDFHLVKRFTRGRRTAVVHPAVSGAHLWLLQTFTDKKRDFRALLKRWDGSEWSRVRVPKEGDGPYYFTSLDVTDDGSVWLTGRDEGDPSTPVILRWDGDGWESTPTPTFPGFSNVDDIDMWSVEEGWAVGSYEADESYRALALRWNGDTWVQVPTPDEGHAELASVSMAAPNDVWSLVRGSGRSAIHWDGVAWTSHRLPKRKGHTLQPWDIEARSSAEAWIAGAWEKRSSASALLSWDGSEWSDVAVTDRRGHDWLVGIESGTAVWTVGEKRTRNGVTPMALRDAGEGWKSVRADNPGRGGHLSDVVVDDGIAWSTGRASSRKHGLYGVLQKACLHT